MRLSRLMREADNPVLWFFAQPMSSLIGVPPLAIFMGRPRLDVWTTLVGIPSACDAVAQMSPGK